MSLTRRQLLQIGMVGGASAALGCSALAEEHPMAPPEAVGMLYDATKCIGCKSCVVACASENGLSPDTRVDPLHQSPNDLNSFTKNIIKLYTPADGQGPYSFVKRQCMHCLDPFCVAACPFHALEKDRSTGVVGWEAEKCIGCRYCQVACPYEIPKFEWDAVNARIVKCEFCKERLAKDEEPACTTVCPTQAVIFGRRDVLLKQAKKRITDTPSKYFDDRVYGEKEAGGTQVLYLSAVGFDKLGLPSLPADEHPSQWLKWSERVQKYFLLPIGIYGVIVGFLKQNFREHEEEMDEEQKKTGLIPQL
jgi:formate dehydrogenase beta subunit